MLPGKLTCSIEKQIILGKGKGKRSFRAGKWLFLALSNKDYS